LVHERGGASPARPLRSVSPSPSPTLGLGRESHLVVDRIEGVLGQHLRRLDVAIPCCSAYVGLAGGVTQYPEDSEAGGTAERGRDTLKGAAASCGSTATVDHLADLCQVDRHAADRGRRANLVAA